MAQREAKTGGAIEDMCKVGILLMAADLYISDYELFQSIVSLFFQTTKTAGGEDDGVDAMGTMFNFSAHLVALAALVLAYRGSVNRMVAGRIVLPVLVVKTLNLAVVKDNINGNRRAIGDFTGFDLALAAKSWALLGVALHLAFGGDKSCVGPDEWFPWSKNHGLGEEGELGKKEAEGDGGKKQSKGSGSATKPHKKKKKKN